MIKEALLGLLTTGTMHGYDLKISLDKLLGQTSKFNVGQVYTALAKLEKVDLRDELFVKLSLASRSGGPDVEVIIRTQRSANLRGIQELTALKAQYEAAASGRNPIRRRPGVTSAPGPGATLFPARRRNPA